MSRNPASPSPSRDAHKDVLELAAGGAPTQDVLDALVRAASRLISGDTRAAIFCVDAAGERLRFAAAAGVAESYTRAADGFPIGPTQPGCAQAAHTGKTVIVRDVRQDALWAPHVALADAHEIRACWSFPLHGATGKYLGSFAVYHRTPREPTPDEYSEVAHLANIAALVLERHKTAEERALEQRRAEAALQEANHRKDRFIAVLAHELRNPLNAISMALNTARLSQDDDRPTPAAYSVMERQLAQMTRLVDDLLDLGRIAQGKIELRTERMELRTAVQAAVEAVVPQCEDKGQTLELSLPPEPLHLKGDAARVTQIVGNLLQNACRFSEPGGRLWLTLARNRQEACIRVRDQGMGIGPEDRERIFDMFAQADAHTTDSPRGLGIGLHLVKQLTTLHGGEIEVHSDGPGTGSEFIVRLPLAEDRGAA